MTESIGMIFMRNKPYPLYDIPQISDLKELVCNQIVARPDEIAFRFRERKNIIEKSCRTFADEVNALGTFLYDQGFMHSHIAIIGENSYEWLLTFFAIVNGGNVAVPIDKELPGEEMAALIRKSDCQAIFYSKTYDDFIPFLTNEDNTQLFCLKELSSLLERGLQKLEAGNRQYMDAVINCDDTAAIFFTSGTTGSSKGVMLSHRNIASNISSNKGFMLYGDTIAILPFHHLFGLVVGVLMVMNYGYTIQISGSLKYIQRDMQQYKPYATCLVPIFIEAFYKQIWDTARKENKDGMLRKLMAVSNFLLKFGIDLRKKLFSSVMAAFGGNLQCIVCGGAALDDVYVKAFRSWGIAIFNGYGITECSPVVSVNRNCYWRDGSVGLVLDSYFVRIADDGEILVKGDNVMQGYYNDTETTAAVLQDGWYSTGDLGRIDEDGFLFITGRKKNLIILSNGENISPEQLEQELARDTAIEEVIIYSKNGQLCAEIYPTEAYLENHEYFEALRQQFNRSQPTYRQLTKIILRTEEFEKNTSRKILRHKINGDA